MAGLSVVGRSYYGVFPLRGKLLNVREASAKQITENAEINYLKKILGLKQGEKYDKENSVKMLRYGHLMIMADQVENHFAVFLFLSLLYVSYQLPLLNLKYFSLLVQDHDGSHIKGLVINFIHTFWPSLLKNPSFMLEFITPIVKVCSTSLYSSLSYARCYASKRRRYYLFTLTTLKLCHAGKSWRRDKEGGTIFLHHA